MNAIFNAGKKNNFTGLQKGVIKRALEVAGNMSANPTVLNQFILGNGVKAIIEFIIAVFEIPDLIANGVTALARLAVNDQVISEIIKYEGLPLIVKIYQKYNDVLELLRSLAFLIGKIGRNEQVKKTLGDLEIHKFLINGFNLFKTDIPLGTYSALALGGLSYNYNQISDDVIKSIFVNEIKDLAKNNIQNAPLIENTCFFFNGLAFKNLQNKKELGKNGVLADIVTFFDHYSQQPQIQLETLKQCFK